MPACMDMQQCSSCRNACRTVTSLAGRAVLGSRMVVASLVLPFVHELPEDKYVLPQGRPAAHALSQCPGALGCMHCLLA